MCHLSVLHLRSSSVKDDLTIIASKISKNNESLDVLDLSGSGNMLYPRSLESFVKRCTQLAELNLSGNDLTEFWNASSTTLPIVSRFTRLSLNNCKNLANCFQVLSKCSQLQSLEMEDNSIRNAEYNSVLDFVRTNTTLTHLNIRDNRIEFSDSAIDLIKQNTTLTELVITSKRSKSSKANIASDYFSEQLFKILKRNRT